MSLLKSLQIWTACKARPCHVSVRYLKFRRCAISWISFKLMLHLHIPASQHRSIPASSIRYSISLTGLLVVFYLSTTRNRRRRQCKGIALLFIIPLQTWHKFKSGFELFPSLRDSHLDIHSILSRLKTSLDSTLSCTGYSISTVSTISKLPLLSVRFEGSFWCYLDCVSFSALLEI